MNVNRLGQAVQVGDRLYVVDSGCHVRQVCASENLYRSGSFKYVGTLQADWTDADLAQCVRSFSDERQRKMWTGSGV